MALTPSSKRERGHYDMDDYDITSAPDCPMDHVKFTVRTETSEGSSGRRRERTGMMNFKGQSNTLSQSSNAIDLSGSLRVETRTAPLPF
ncbi:hypothetical protein EVAR_67813_1 [Eumeta japonica]|uniref:Uncharacterized protein n=1 Tax=Eumeta variegata TaxID=151549 RepID=A0A4C1ZZ33_EUMVA|nr:hypothetical protein EVAR_67813_1 [Eumeta japonica]